MRTLQVPSRLFSAALIILALSLTACGSAAAPPLAPTHITVQLNWTHDAQFAGFYEAVQHGYYRDEGLDVTLVAGGIHIDAAQRVADGAAQFGVDVAERLMLRRAEGSPLRAIAAIFRRSPIVLYSLASAHITRPSDLVGRTINASPDTAPTLHAMLAHASILPGQYTEVNIGPDYSRLYSGAVPVYAGFVIAGVVKLQRAGHKLNLIFPDDYGVHFYGSTIVATDAFIAAHPAVVQRFLRATLKGWTDAVEHPSTAGPLVAAYLPHTDAALEVAEMTASLPLINTGEDHIGWMKPEIWAGMARILRAQHLLARPLDITQVYSMRFLHAIYGGSG